MSLLEQLSKEWKTLETRVRLGLSKLDEVSEFLRTWTTRAGVEAAPEERELLLSMLHSASQTLTAQADDYQEMIARGKRERELAAEKSQLENSQRAQAEATRAERAEYDRRQRERTQREAAEKLEKTREQTRAIQREAAKIQQEGRERQNLFNRILTNPELYCPHCNRAYADKTGGCRHCTVRIWP